MSSQSNQLPELNQADASEAPTTGQNRFAKVPPDLHDLLERGEISSEEFALYLEMADAAEANCRLEKRSEHEAPIVSGHA
jgi:hypothetical protein